MDPDPDPERGLIVEKDSPVLNLDELFANPIPIIVVLGGERFSLTRPEDLEARDLTLLTKLQNDTKTAIDQGGDNVEVLDELLDRFILIVCPDLAKQNLKFGQKFRLIKFYFDETKEPDPDKEKKTSDTSTPV